MIGPDGTLATATTYLKEKSGTFFLSEGTVDRDNKAERVKTVVSSTTDFRNVNHL